MDCSRAVGWWTPNLWFVVSVFQVVDGTGVFVVWWSVVFVFLIVDGTGMFECFFLVVERVDLICCVCYGLL